jgi:transcriptional regulator with XRE-family HTH domain
VRRSQTPFVEELPRLLQEREMSLRAVAAQSGVSSSYLSRVLRRVEYKTPGPELVRRVAVALGLPHDYFPEFREGFVVDRVKADRKLRDRLYDRLKRQDNASTTH